MAMTALVRSERESLNQLLLARDRLLDIVVPDIVHITLLHGLHPGAVEHVHRQGIPGLVDEHPYECGCPQLVLYGSDQIGVAGATSGR